jgi:hypothetical protein
MPHDAPPDPPATTLARGPAKTEDIERSRRDLQRAEKRVTEALRAAAARHDHDPSGGRGPARDGS